mgnify:CR=1 FL=1
MTFSLHCVSTDDRATAFTIADPMHRPIGFVTVDNHWLDGFLERWTGEIDWHGKVPLPLLRKENPK